jgi:hypothetical protein
MRNSEPCNRTFTAKQNSGIRNLSDIKLVVIHDAENSNALSVARFFANTNEDASAHLVVGQTTCYRCLPDDVIPMAAPGANTIGVHIEQAGFARWTRDEWLNHLKTIKRCAYKAARLCHKYHLGPHFLDASALRAGRTGITTHNNVSLWQKALNAPGDHSHTDPGPNYPIDVFMHWVGVYHDKMR